MTIDERLEALTARHEALAQSMELTHHDIQDALRIAKELTAQIAKHDDQLDKLLQLARLQNERITRLEDHQ